MKRTLSNVSVAAESGLLKKPDASTSSANESTTKIINSIYGIADVKPEYVVAVPTRSSTDDLSARSNYTAFADEAAEEEGVDERLLESLGADSQGKNGKNNKKNKKRNRKETRGQNKNRDNTQQKETIMLCGKYKFGAGNGEVDGEGNPVSLCKFKGKCKFSHDLGEYLAGKQSDVSTDYFSVCPVFSELGYCPMGFKCKFLNTHLTTCESDNSSDQPVYSLSYDVTSIPADYCGGEVNCISLDNKFHLMKKRFQFPDSDWILNVQEAFQQEYQDTHPKKDSEENTNKNTDQVSEQANEKREALKKVYDEYKDTRYWSREKKSALDYHRKKVLSPLTTVGNLPYRRLMKNLGCDVTFSEMALSLPLIQGANSEWALMKAHKEEVPGFAVQIATNKPWQAAKACEAIVKLLPNSSRDIREINLNCGCPIDLLYKQGSGSGLLDNPGRMIRILNAMSFSSGDIPVSCKIRIGTKDDQPLAKNLMRRLVWETDVGSITLHGRTRQQRYTKASNWSYIKECAQELRKQEGLFQESHSDIERNNGSRIQFLGNGDLYYWKDWYDLLDDCPEMDSIMVARGALIKPWIFEEIDAQQSLDKTSGERMEILGKYLKFAMDHWGTDEYGLNQCRRFFLEFMSFFHRYIPVGILTRQNKLNERPPVFQGRNELETLLSSSNVNDWVKISEMFLGKAPESFQFTPKHKSNSFVKN